MHVVTCRRRGRCTIPSSLTFSKSGQKILLYVFVLIYAFAVCYCLVLLMIRIENSNKWRSLTFSTLKRSSPTSLCRSHGAALQRWTRRPTLLISRSVSTMYVLSSLFVCFSLTFVRQITLWTSREVLEASNPNRRIAKIAHFIEIAQLCYDYNNFHGLKSILSGLQCTPVYRLSKTWAVRDADRHLFHAKCFFPLFCSFFLLFSCFFLLFLAFFSLLAKRRAPCLTR